MTVVKVERRGLRGEGFGETARRVGAVGPVAIEPADSDAQVLTKVGAGAAADRAAAEAARDLAQAAALTAPTVYATVAAGLAAVADGATFWAESADGPNLYRRAGAAANLISTIATLSKVRDIELSVTEHGALCDGVADDSAAAQAAYDALAAAGGGWLAFPAGRTCRASITLTSRTVHLRGQGGAAIVKPATDAGVALRVTAVTSGWRQIVIRDLVLAAAVNGSGTGIRTGAATYTASAEYIGRVLCENVVFANLDKGVDRPFGNIGFTLTDCRFEGCNFDTYNVANDPAVTAAGATAWAAGTVYAQGAFVSNSGIYYFVAIAHTANADINVDIAAGRLVRIDAMHAGNMALQRCHAIGFQKAHHYVDGKSVTGTCQILDLDGIQEVAPGHVLFLKDVLGYGTPAVRMASLYNEATATAASVTIGADTGPAQWLKAANCRSQLLLLEDCAPGAVTLVDSAIVTRNCDLTYFTSLTADAKSSCIHENARTHLGQPRGRVRSVSQPIRTADLNAPAYAMPPPAARSEYGAATIAVTNGQAVEAWSGTVARNSVLIVNDPAMPGLPWCQEQTLNAGEQLLPPPAIAVPAASHNVMQVLARLVSGPAPNVQVTGAVGFGGAATVRDAEWTLYSSIFTNNGAAVGDSFYFTHPGGAASVFRYAVLAVSTFATLQQALDFLNARMPPATARQAWTLTNGAPSRVLDATAAAGADLAAAWTRITGLEKVVATLAEDIRKGVGLK